MSRLAAFISPRRSIEEAVERVRLAESLGYHSAWIEQVAARDAVVVAAAYASSTSTIGIGTGVLPFYPRTPAVTAQTAATLDDLSKGRFILGLGPSHKVTVEGWHGMKLEKPLLHTRDYVAAVRALLRGEVYDGEVYRSAFTFMGFTPPRNDLPIYLSCLSPRMCRLAGEIADGAVLWMCAPGYIEKVVVPAIAEGRDRTGRSMEGFEVVSAVPLSLTADPSQGRDGFRRAATVYWNLPFYRAAVEGGGFSGAVAEFDAKGPSGIPDDVVDAFAGAGDERACREAVERYRAAGVTLPGVAPLPRHDGSASVEDLLKAVA